MMTIKLLSRAKWPGVVALAKHLGLTVRRCCRNKRHACDSKCHHTLAHRIVLVIGPVQKSVWQ